MNKPRFAIGMYAIPKKTCEHAEFIPVDRKKRFRIISIETCSGSDNDGCKGCPGNPHVLIESESIELCGYGAPWSNFDFICGDWDE